MARGRLAVLIGMLAIGTMITSCKKAPEPQPENNAVSQPPQPPVAAPEPAPTPAPEPTNTAEAAPVPKPAPAAAPSADEQIRYDAEATGMTSRVARDTDTMGDTGTPSAAANAQN